MVFHSFEMKALTTRRLRYAVAVSLLVHLLILWPANLRVLTKDTPSLLQATLRLVPPPATDLVPPKPPPHAAFRQETSFGVPDSIRWRFRFAGQRAPSAGDAAAVSTGGITIAPLMPKPISTLLDQPQPASVPKERSVSVEPVSRPLPGPETVAVAASATSVPGLAAGSPSGALLTETNAYGEAVDGLRGYRLALAIQARRFKQYPPQAMASGWTGSADIRVEVGSDGQPHSATVVRSSGHQVLDRAALAMIDASTPRARLPESLRGKTFAVVLPVVFNLGDE
jgi:protein TonB